MAILDRPCGGNEGLTGDLSAEDALAVLVGRTAAKEVHFDGLQVEQFDEVIERLLHQTMLAQGLPRVAVPLWCSAMSSRSLDADQLLMTTRAVRKRLDFSRPVNDDVLRECVAAAMQSPSGSNVMSMQFVIVRDVEKRSAIGEIYRQCYEQYKTMPWYAGAVSKESVAEQSQQTRVARSADYLGEHMGDAPALVIACNASVRTDGLPGQAAAALLANVMPAMWSFMLAARARGLGTAWTTVHLAMEEQVAELVGIPYATVQQVCLSPVAYTIGTEFKPAMRPEPDTIIHWDQW